MRHGLFALAICVTGAQKVEAYANEVYKVENTYRWKIDNTERGSSADLAEAITKCIWDSKSVGREIHVLVSGDLSNTLGLPPDVSLYCHGNTFTRSHGGIGIYCKGVSNIGIHDMTLSSGTHMGIQTTACNNVVLTNITILSGYIGIRVDSHKSRPFGFWSHNLTVKNCRFENLGSHGLETYGIDGLKIENIVSRNNGECGVLLNKSYNGKLSNIDSFRCSYKGGYAGLRFANDCKNITVDKLKAVECGRGFFTVSKVTDCTVNEVYIRGCSAHAILLQNSDNVVVKKGTYSGDALNHYTSVNCEIKARQVRAKRSEKPNDEVQKKDR